MIIGLTGCIACGKSLVLQYFREKKQWGGISCDELNHQILDTHVDIQSAIQSKWGSELLKNDGKLDKIILGSIVFKDRSALNWLEDLLHPRINALWRQEIQNGMKKRPHWIVEVPLLFEKNLENLFDYTVCISISREQQYIRLRKRNEGSDNALSRIKRQMPLEKKMQRADFIINNDGSKQFLKKQINQLIYQLLI